MDIHERSRGEVRLFCGGGGGMNIGHKVDSYANTNNSSDKFGKGSRSCTWTRPGRTCALTSIP